MKINKSFRYELNPNNQQRTLLMKHCGAARFAWNWSLALRKQLYNTKTGKDRFISTRDQLKLLDELKKTDFPWLYEVSKYAPQCALDNLDRRYSDMIKQVKNHEGKISKPQFKKKGKHDSFKLVNDHFDRAKQSIMVYGNRISFPKIRMIRTKESTNNLRGRILSANISRDVDRWFCSLNVETDIPEPKVVQGDIVGIDLGLNDFAVIADGVGYDHVKAPKPLNKYLVKIKRLHRQRDRKRLKSKNYNKANLRLVRKYRKVRNIRKDFLNKITTKLAKTKSVIVIEDLNVQGMKSKKKHLARSILDVGWGKFRLQLKYKTGWYGSRMVVIPRFEPSSKRCHVCGMVNRGLKANDRKWICLNCGTVHDRDENASENIRECGIEMMHTESSSGINACGVGVRPKVLEATLVSEAVHDEAGSKHAVSLTERGTVDVVSPCGNR